MPNILHRLSIDAPPERVHQLAATREGIQQWWTGTIVWRCVDGPRRLDRYPDHLRAETQAGRRHHTAIQPPRLVVECRARCTPELARSQESADDRRHLGEQRQGCGVRTLGRAAGSTKTGLNHVRLEPGATGPPSHCHALEEELFYVLEGSGTVTLGAEDQHPLRPGDVVARPPATGVAHRIRAGEHGMTYLAYGTRVPGDSVYYPETGKVRLRGLGVTIDASRE